MTAADSTTAIEATFRIERPRLIGALVRMVRDIDLAEDLAQDALVAALEQWPRDGTPRNPGAWLTTVAKRKAIDRLRRDQRYEAKKAQLVVPTEVGEPPGGRRRHRRRPAPPAVRRLPSGAQRASRGSRSPLRLLGGLTTPEIARAFLQPEATVAQRISRAKRTIAESGVPFDVPTGDDRAARISSVLEVVYLVYNEGYSATTGPDWLRPDLCGEALRLARLMASVVPDDPEVHGLLALLELQSSRLSARVGPDREPVLLRDQDWRRWDRLLITRGLASLERAHTLTDAPGPYTLQAEIAACHARAGRAEDTDWGRLVDLYGLLARAMPSPVVELNRAVAVSMHAGPADALTLVDELLDEGSLDRYHLLHSVHGDLLERLGRHADAQAAFERAASLSSNVRERALSEARAEASAAASDRR